MHSVAPEIVYLSIRTGVMHSVLNFGAIDYKCLHDFEKIGPLP